MVHMGSHDLGLLMLARVGCPPLHVCLGGQTNSEIPVGTSYEVVQADALPDWHLPDSPSARRFGHLWYAERRSAILVVPSVVARPERNVIINASHPEFSRLVPGDERPVWWDERLFR